MKSSSLLKSTRLDVLGITEGKLTFSAKDEALEIIGYKLIRKDDGDGGGGCLLYFAEDLRLMEKFFFVHATLITLKPFGLTLYFTDSVSRHHYVSSTEELVIL